MNICIVTTKYPPDPGGLAVSARRLARGLAAEGHAVRVSVPADSGAPGETACADDGGIPIYRIGTHRRADDTLSDWFDHLTALHRAQPLDMLHALYVTEPAFVAVSAGRYLGVPTVISARGNDLDRAAFDPAKFSQISWSLQTADAVTAVTTDLARKAQVFAPGRHVYYIPNGVDTGEFSPGPADELRSSLGLGERPAIVFTGEARRKKGLIVLLQALAQLAASRREPPPALFLVGGVRKDDEPILQVFKRQHPDVDVRVVAYQPHEGLAAWYRLATVLALPSLHDGLPNSLLEGMACGCAVVASDVGGMPDVVRHGENGQLVPPGDASALAAALDELLSDPARRERLGAAARATVENCFTPLLEIRANLEVYQRL